MNPDTYIFHSFTTQVIILRGVSGSGKSTVANLFKNPKVICCADDYFTDDEGNYNFDPSKRGDAHEYCRKQFDDALSNGRYRNIIVANTNSKPSEWEYYENRAKELGVEVCFLVVENRHGNKDIHNVPESAIQRQKTNITHSLKLV